MKISSIELDGERVLAARDGENYVNLTALNARRYASMRTLLAAGPAALEEAEHDLRQAPKIGDATKVVFLPLVPDATKILCVGRNYADHAVEQAVEIPGEPLVFAKAPSALAGHRQVVRLPAQSHQVDYEAELVAVIGSRAHKVNRQDAMNHIAGFTCGNDVTARDWQKGKPGQQWLLGKSFDTFAPVGPYLVTADEVPEPGCLTVEMRLNGQLVQQASTEQMMFSIDFLVAYISQVMTLEPGDLLFTGTPAGVGFAKEPPQFLQSGDEMAIEISGVGRLVNHVSD